MFIGKEEASKAKQLKNKKNKTKTSSRGAKRKEEAKHETLCVKSIEYRILYVYVALLLSSFNVTAKRGAKLVPHAQIRLDRQIDRKIDRYV